VFCDDDLTRVVRRLYWAAPHPLTNQREAAARQRSAICSKLAVSQSDCSPIESD